MPIFILAAARTPFGAFGGALRGVGLADLGAHALRETLGRGDLEPVRVREVVLGCALPAGHGHDWLHRAVCGAGLPSTTPSFAVSAGTLSGLKAVLLAAQAFSGHPGSFALAGGLDSASRSPFLVPTARWGRRIGETDLLDALLIDSPWGVEEIEAAEESESADWQAASRRRAEASRAFHNRSLAPMALGGRTPSVLDRDDPPEASRVPLPPLRAPLADGAAALLLGDAPLPGRLPLARIQGWAESGDGPRSATEHLLERLGWSPSSVDRWEIHESSPRHPLELLKAFPGLDPARVNPRGGALALGDPWGASGPRLLQSVALELDTHGLATGLAVVTGAHGHTLAVALSRS